VEALTAFVPLVGVVLVVALVAGLTGVVSGSSVPALQYWSLHPWRIFWLSYVLIFAGLLLWTVLRPIALALLIPGMLLMLTCAIQGLRVTWMRSRGRAMVILVIALAGLSLPELTQGRWLLALISPPLGILLWIFSAWLAETVGTRQGAGVSPRRDIETSYDAHQRSKYLEGATDTSLPKPRKSKRRYKVAWELRLGIMLIAMMALLWLLVLR
jgi:hypothetical protein